MVSGTNARRIAVHFWPALTVISCTSCLTYRSNSGVPGVASGPRIEQLSESASALNRTPRETTVGCERSRCAVEAEPVKPSRSCSSRWSSRSPALPHTYCSAPSGSNPDSTISSTMREVRYAVCEAGLIERRDARDEGRGELLQRAPDREVERVDLYGDSAQRRQDVLAEELPALAERFGGALDVDRLVRQLALGLARVAEHDADAAVDVEPRVEQRGTGAGGELVQLLAVLAQHAADSLEQRGALVEGQLAQRRAADRPAVLQCRAHVDALGRDPGDLVAGHRVVHGRTLVVRARPTRHRRSCAEPSSPPTSSSELLTVRSVGYPLQVPDRQGDPVAVMIASDEASRALGIVVDSWGDGRATARMTVRTDMVNGYEIAHGGLVFALADTAFAAACNSVAAPTVAAGADITFVDVRAPRRRTRSHRGAAHVVRTHRHLRRHRAAWRRDRRRVPRPITPAATR